MATKTKTLTPKLNIQRNYITLKLPTGNFTTSMGGAKASGQLVHMKGAFTALDRYVQNATKTKSFLDAMNDLLDTKLLDELVPGWDNPVVAETFQPGDRVELKSPLFKKKYPGTYEVRQTKGKFTYVLITNPKTGTLQSMGFDSTELTKI